MGNSSNTDHNLMMAGGALVAGLFVFAFVATEHDWLVIGGGLCAIALVAWAVWRRRQGR